jgi:hypothetical protein
VGHLERIDTLGGELAAEIRSAPADDLRRMAIAVAALVSKSHPELPAEFRTAVELLESGATEPDNLARVSREADRLDDTYLEMHFDEKPGGQTDGWERAYSTARAAFAIRFACDSDPFTAASEAAYEAVAALDDDEATVLRAVRHAKSRDIAPR